MADQKSKDELFETPMVAKRDVLEKASKGEEEGERIYVMPPLKEKKKETGAKKRIWPIILIFIIVIALLGGGLLWYIKGPPVLVVKQPPKKIEKPQPSVQPPKKKPAQFSEQTIKAEITNKEGKMISRAELYLPQGAFSPETKVELKGKLPESLAQSGDYRLLNGFYQIILNKPDKLLKPAILKIFYQDESLTQSQEAALKIGYLKDNQWHSLASQADQTANQIVIILEKLVSDKYGIILSPKEFVKYPIAPFIASSYDADKDGLTEPEEKMYQTGVTNSDTDGDGYPDGLEVVNLYSPLSGPGDGLALSNLIRSYSNTKYSYKIYYPTGWLVKPLPETEESEIVFIPPADLVNTGEFFEVIVQEAGGLTAKEWYEKQISAEDISKIKTSVIDGKKAVWSLDGLSVYLDNLNKIYALTYNIGLAETGVKQEANFKSTFAMFLKSFKLETGNATSTPTS